MRSGCLFFLVVLMVTSLGQAKPRYSKDWVLDIDGNDFLYASTLNSSRHILDNTVISIQVIVCTWLISA